MLPAPAGHTERCSCFDDLGSRPAMECVRGHFTPGFTLGVEGILREPCNAERRCLESIFDGIKKVIVGPIFLTFIMERLPPRKWPFRVADVPIVVYTEEQARASTQAQSQAQDQAQQDIYTQAQIQVQIQMQAEAEELQSQALVRAQDVRPARGPDQGETEIGAPWIPLCPNNEQESYRHRPPTDEIILDAISHFEAMTSVQIEAIHWLPGRWIVALPEEQATAANVRALPSQIGDIKCAYVLNRPQNDIAGIGRIEVPNLPRPRSFSKLCDPFQLRMGETVYVETPFARTRQTSGVFVSYGFQRVWTDSRPGFYWIGRPVFYLGQSLTETDVENTHGMPIENEDGLVVAHVAHIFILDNQIAWATAIETTEARRLGWNQV